MDMRLMNLGRRPGLRGDPVEQHRTIRVADDVLGHAADHQPAQTLAARGCHRDQVHVEGLGLIEDLIGGGSKGHHRARLDAFLRELMGEFLDGRGWIG